MLLVEHGGSSAAPAPAGTAPTATPAQTKSASEKGATPATDAFTDFTETRKERRKYEAVGPPQTVVDPKERDGPALGGGKPLQAPANASTQEASEFCQKACDTTPLCRSYDFCEALKRCYLSLN